MRIDDLGGFSGDVLLYGGPYGNRAATTALFDAADAAGIAPAARICTGDVAAYAAEPVATIEAVMARGGAVVAGNCERQLARGAADCGCGFVSGSVCDVLSQGWYPHALAAVAGRPDLRAWLDERPGMALFRHAGRRWAVIHGGATDIARFVWPDSPDAVFAEEVARIEAAAGPVDGVVAGHAGIAFQRRVAGVTWLNAGAVGLPPHDGHPATRYAVLSEDGARIHRLDYDHAETAAAMRAAGLTQGYEAAMETGLWPSEDILPPSLRRAG